MASARAQSMPQCARQQPESEASRLCRQRPPAISGAATLGESAAISDLQARSRFRKHYGATQALSDGEDAPFADRLQRSRTAQHPGRKHNDAAYHPKYSVDRYPRNAERNQKDPHERVRDQRE